MSILSEKPDYRIPGIYGIRHTYSNRIYIGQSFDIPVRWRMHMRDLVHSRHQNEELSRHFKDDGAGSLQFTILEVVNEEGARDEAELRWITALGGEQLMNHRRTKPTVKRTPKFRSPKLRGVANHMSKLSASEVVEIRRRYAQGGVTQQQLGDEHGVNQRTIGRIIRREWWEWIDDDGQLPLDGVAS